MQAKWDDSHLITERNGSSVRHPTEENVNLLGNSWNRHQASHGSSPFYFSTPTVHSSQSNSFASFSLSFSLLGKEYQPIISVSSSGSSKSTLWRICTCLPVLIWWISDWTWDWISVVECRSNLGRNPVDNATGSPRNLDNEELPRISQRNWIRQLAGQTVPKQLAKNHPSPLLPPPPPPPPLPSHFYLKVETDWFGK